MLLDEDILPLEAAAKATRAHFSTIYRWVLRGARGPSGQRVRLEAVRLGGRWITSRQALERFTQALTPDLDRQAEPEKLRSESRREAAARRSGERLAAKGW